MNFDPNFLTDRPVWADEFIIDSCVSVFSISTDSEQPLISYDPDIADLVIKSSKDLSNINLLSVLFDFAHLLKIENPDSSIVIYLRKLYALSFFSGQYDSIERINIIREILNIINELTTEESQSMFDELLIELFAATVSFSLATISEYFKEIQFTDDNEESQLYFEMANTVLKIFNNEDIKNIEKSYPYFIEYFLTILLSFPINPDKKPTEEQNYLLEQLLKITLSNLDCFKSQIFNYGALLIYLLKFFESNYSIPVQIDILKLISRIYEKNPQFSEFLFNYQNFEMFSKFFVFVISNAGISIDKEAKKKSDFFVDPDQQFTDEDILNISTFDEPVTHQISLQSNGSNQAGNCSSFNPPADLPSFYQCSYFKSFLEAIFIFCKLNPKSGHIQYMKKIMIFFRREPTFSATTFLLMWGREYITKNYPNATDDLVKIGFFDTMLELTFDTLKCSEYKEFMSSLYLYILKNRQQNQFFIGTLFSRYEISIIQLEMDEQLNNLIIGCCSIFPEETSHYFTPIFYDQRLSHLLQYLQNTHLAASLSHNHMKHHISKVRLMFLRYVAFLLSNEHYKSILYISPLFVNSLLLMFLESSTNEFAYHFIFDSLLVLKKQDRSVSTIFTFFQKILKKALQNEKFQPISTQIMQIISSSFEQNTETIAGVFLHTNFFPALVNYVSFLNSKENMYLLLNIARKCTLIQGDIADYLYEIDLFSKIYPLAIFIFESNIPDEFFELLWSFVFNDESMINNNSSNSQYSKVRRIMNASPLTLIYKLLRPNEEAFLRFINYIQNCCDNDLKSALEVNNSNFPSALISTFEEYHEMTERSSTFDSVLALFSSLAAHSLKSRDALSFFHNFSSLKGDFRPYFTVDLLKTLLFLFQSPFDSPYSFYNLDKSNGMIYLPTVQVPKFYCFTFFIEIDLTEKPDYFGVLFSFELRNVHFSLFFKNSQLAFEIGYIGQKITGSFNYIFTPHTWTHIAITYQNGNIILYVHGKEQANLKVSNIIFPEGEMKSYLARNVSCNIGNFGFLRHVLNSQIIKLLSLFPKTAVTSFMPAEISDFSFDMSQLFSGEIYQNSIYLYNSAISSSKNSSVNLAYVRRIENQMKIDGLIYGYSPQAKDILRSIGGAAAILPIFAQIDQPLMPKPGEEISYKHDPIFLPFLIQVLTSYLKDSPSNQEDFATMNGFMVISYLLSRSKLQNITPQVIEMLKRLYKEIIVPRLAYQMLEYIFLDIRLWIYLPIDLQMSVYRSIFDIFNSSSTEKKRWFVWALPFNKILYIMRVFFWSKYSDDEICLYNQPKINKITQLAEGERPTNTLGIRDLFWTIAQSVFSMSFNNKSASAICFLSFDQNDPQFSVETLSFLLYLLRVKNPIMITALIAQHYTFEKFFSLLASNSEEICCQCIHIFILLHYLDPKSKEILFKPYSETEWIALIMATMNTKPLTSIFADVIYGYLYGFFDISQNVVIPNIRISKLNLPITSGYKFAYLELFPLAMMIIADLPDEVSSKYLMTIDRTVAVEVPKFTKLPEWDLPFIMFLIHRVPTSQDKFDNSSHICLHTLCSLYALLVNDGTISDLPNYIINASCRIGQDFSHILRHVYTYFFDIFIIKQPLQEQQFRQHQRQNFYYQQQPSQSHFQHVEPTIAYSIFLQVFEFLFILNSTSNFYLPPFSVTVAEFDVDPIDGGGYFPSDDENGDHINSSSENNYTGTTRVTFQELHRNKWNAAVPDVQLCYSTRTMDNGAWIDTELAQRLLHAFSLYPEVFNLKYKPSQMHPLFMYSFVLGIGLQHQFPAFERYIKFLMPRIPTDRGINDIQYQSFLNYLSGIVKVYLFTGTTHQSHFYLLQHANAYHQVIQSRLKQPSQMGQNMNEFDHNFSKKPYNFAHVVIEKFSTIEVSMMKYSQKIQRELLKLYSHQSETIAKVSAHFASLNPTDSRIHLSVNNEQVKLQLHQFALSIKTKQRESMKVYRTLWRSLSSEGGPWCPIGNAPVVHWKLEQLQPLSMVRGRFVINHNFSDHKDASLLRDLGKVEDAQNLYNEHLKRIRLSEFTGNHSLITIGVDHDEENKYDLHEQGGGSTTDEMMMPIISSATDNIVLKADANRITMKKVYKGIFLFTNTFLTFNCSDSAKKSVSVPLVSITHIFTRRYLLMDSAIEVFTSSLKSYMFDFPAGQRHKILEELKKFGLPNLIFLQTCDADAQPLLEKIKNKWQSGEISNFDYLMKLNLLAGRTYNDLSQYPVFPWVISDYKSEQLNLDDPQIYRDLSAPIGTLNEDRLQSLLSRRALNTTELDYLYGSFYSSSAVVVGYLIRIEPFTSLHIELQAGRFDVPNRLFNSIPKAWDSVSKAPMDFRELIPEFFYMPEFLVNSNHFDLGVSDTNDVELPPWASSARDFITKNRAALESKYVSAMLPRWIDLIFGVLSRGEESVSVNNVFSPYFFETAITPEVLEDPKQLKFIQEYAACFGHAPRQLFFEPHKSKKFNLMRPPITTFGHKYFILFDVKNPILSLEVIDSRKQKTRRNTDPNQTLKAVLPNFIQIVDSNFDAILYNMSDRNMKRVQLLLNSAIKYDNVKIMTSTVQTKNGFSYSAVPWDNAITISTLTSGAPIHVKRAHTKRITAIAVSNGYYATASLDCTVVLWRNHLSVPQIPMSIMTKHSNCISCIAINENIDLCVSASRNGEIITQSVITGNFIRKIAVRLDSNSEFSPKIAINRAQVPSSSSEMSSSVQDFQSTSSINVISTDSNDIIGTQVISNEDNINNPNNNDSNDNNINNNNDIIDTQIISNGNDNSNVNNNNDNTNVNNNNNSNNNDNNNNNGGSNRKIISASSSISVANSSIFDSNYSSIVVSEPTSIIIFDSGTICVSFAQSDRDTVYVFDQNLEEITHVQLESSLQCWTALEWPDENDYVFAALKSGGLVIYKLPNFELIWSESKVDFVVTRLAVVKNPLQIIFGTTNGQIISLPFQEK